MGSISNLSKLNLTEYRPYSLSRQRDNDVYVDIVFQDEGIMSVPKSSGNAIVDLLNDAFRNGVKVALKTIQTEPIEPKFIEPKFKSNAMPLEEEHPISKKVKRLV